MYPQPYAYVRPAGEFTAGSSGFDVFFWLLAIGGVGFAAYHLLKSDKPRTSRDLPDFTGADTQGNFSVRDGSGMHLKEYTSLNRAKNYALGFADSGGRAMVRNEDTGRYVFDTAHLPRRNPSSKKRSRRLRAAA